jgi:hypothetical protein
MSDDNLKTKIVRAIGLEAGGDISVQQAHHILDALVHTLVPMLSFLPADLRRKTRTS